MPQKRAAKKALRKNIKQRDANVKIREQLKTVIKKFKKAVESKDVSASTEALRNVYKALDKAASKGVIHRNKASRRKGRLAAFFSKISSQKNA